MTSSPPADDVKLFDAPDLAALQRNWPRIALRGSILLIVPFLVTVLAKSLDLYKTLKLLPLPLDFLDVGPFAYEAKVIFTVVATLLGLAFLVPKRTTQLVIAICVGGILWTGHVYIQLQWARLFATKFNFRREVAPGPLAWIEATLLLVSAVVFLLLENLLDTREQQEARSLSKDDTRALFGTATRTLGLLLGLGAAIAATLVGSYLLLRALLADVRLPFRLNPVFVLFGMGVGLAVIVALAARKRSPLAAGARTNAPAPTPTPTPTPTPAPAPAPAAKPAAPATDSWWAGMSVGERVAVLASAFALVSLLLPWTVTWDPQLLTRTTSIGLATLPGAGAAVAAIATLVAYFGREDGRWRRLAPPTLWGLALAPFALAAVRATGRGPFLEAGIFVGFLLALTALGACLVAARRVTPASDAPR
ncbi:MAG TPA: hypothetical protein VM370_02170 [Candidatus Thermoplasmatota archaeon]|nr:hypothetical protein [Candidatus Thermoplasmatota archaeon]